MILLFSRKYGKISAGTSISEKGKSKSTLAMHPFTLGKYEIYKGRDSFNINGADTLKSFYQIGENVDKYMASSYILEWTEKVLPEQVANVPLLNLLIDFLTLMEDRKKAYGTLVLAYQVKALQLLGYMPVLDQCSACGSKEVKSFSIESGGMVCEKCKDTLLEEGQTLIYDTNFDIVEVLKYIVNNPLRAMEKLALEQDVLRPLLQIIKKYAEYHMDIGKLKSEDFLVGMI
ncbi:MAG: DNA repair protein RecO [Clostridia bacterium]|nr:DNA repair protein RecO [Clostridia bacterium]